MLKVKVFLVAVFFAGVTFSTADASVLSPSDVENDEIQSLGNVPDADKKILDIPKESDVPFQEELEMDTVVVYPPLDVKEEPKKYTVVKGDSLSGIAKEYNISLDALMSWNGLAGDLIHPGDVFIVNGNPEDVRVVEFDPYNPEPSKVNVAVVPAPTPTPSPVSEKGKGTPSTTPVAKAKEPPITVPASGGVEMNVTATAYTAYCNGCSGTTAYGIDLRANPNQKVIAVDPSVIPLGTRVWVEGYGEAIAGDTGGAIKGNKIDVFIPTKNAAYKWGRKNVKITILD